MGRSERALVILFSLAFGCDAGALELLAKDVTVETVAAKLASACRTPIALNAALKKPDDVWQELQIGLSKEWIRICPDSLDALPDGFTPPDANHRLRLYNACEVDAQLVTAGEFMGSSGPALTTIAFAAAAKGVDLPTRRTLVRALLGIREGGAAASLTPARQSKAEEVVWPWNAKKKGAHCVVDATIFENGRLGMLHWIDCEDEWQPYIRMALEQSIFEPAQQNAQPVASLLRLSFKP